MDLLKIAKIIYASGMFLKVIQKYLQKIKKQYCKQISSGNLEYNFYIKIKINKHDIANKLNSDFNYIYIQFCDETLPHKAVKTIGIDCSDIFKPKKLYFPKPYQGFMDNNSDSCPEIHIGLDCNNLNWGVYQDTVEHQLVHCFELFYGYSNKNLNYNFGDDYDDSFANFQHINNITDEFNWKLQGYYGSNVQFSAYLTNLISTFKKMYSVIKDKDKLKSILRNTNFTDFRSVRQLCIFFNKNRIYDIAPLFWLYHLNSQDVNLFNKAVVKLLKRIDEF